MEKKNQKQPKQATQETTNVQNPTPQEQPKPEAQDKPKKQPQKKAVDPGLYEKYINLKFLALSGAKLPNEKQKELADLEKEVKSCSGPIAKKTVRAAINNEICLMVEGMPVSENIVKIVDEAKKSDYYFVK